MFDHVITGLLLIVIVDWFANDYLLFSLSLSLRLLRRLDIHDVIPHVFDRVELSNVLHIKVSSLIVGCLEEVIVHVVDAAHRLLELLIMTLLEEICCLGLRFPWLHSSQ